MMDGGRFPFAFCPWSFIQYRVAQRGAEAVKNGCLVQECLDLFWLAGQDLVHQVVDDIAVAAGKGCDELVLIWPPLQRQCRQLQAGDPAFGPRFEGGDVPGRQAEAHQVIEKGGRFLRGES